MTAINDITGDKIATRVVSEQFKNNFDGIDFSKKLVLCDVCGKDMDLISTCENTQCSKFWDEARADTIGSNGNVGYE